MPFPLIPLIAGGASLLGGYLANRGKKQEAQKQRDFQERMSGTSYQRAVEDMRLSGINPMLAYQQGGASTPSGAQASIDDVMSPAVSSASHAARLKQELSNMRAQEQTTIAQKNALNASARQSQTQGHLNVANEANVVLNNRVTRLGMPRIEQLSNLDKNPFGKGLTFIERARQAVFGGSTVPLAAGFVGGRLRRKP